MSISPRKGAFRVCATAPAERRPFEQGAALVQRDLVTYGSFLSYPLVLVNREFHEARGLSGRTGKKNDIAGDVAVVIWYNGIVTLTP